MTDERRQPPSEIDVEQALLGVVLVDSQALNKVSQILRAGHFFDPLHQRMFATIHAMRDRGDAVTPLTLKAAMRQDPGLAEMGHQNYFENLARSAPVMPNVTAYCQIIAECAARRELISAADEILARAYTSPDSPIADQIAGALSLLDTARASYTSPRSRALQAADVAAWGERPVPEQAWWDMHRIPMENVTLCSGDGGAGKTSIMMHALGACVLGREWLGQTPRKGPALGIFCEDDDDQLHLRFSRVAAHYGASFKELSDSGLLPVSLAGKDAVLAVPDRNGIIRQTPLYSELLIMARDHNPTLIVLDNSADLFAGNENDRAQVRQFISLLRRLAIETRSAVVLSSHPSLTGINSGSGISGSTAWNASVRSRLYLHTPKPEGDEPADPNERVLEVMKSNYGPAGETIRLRWNNGLFLPISSDRVHWLDRQTADRKAEELFLQLLAKAEQEGRPVSHNKNAPSYAPTRFAKHPDAKTAGIRKASFEHAMEQLFATGKIRSENYGKPSRPCWKIAASAVQKAA